MKVIECKPHWCESYAYERICEEVEACGDTVATKFGGVVMCSDEPIEVFRRRYLTHINERSKALMERRKDPKVKMSIITNVLNICQDMGYINESAHNRIIELIKEEQ